MENKITDRRCLVVLGGSADQLFMIRTAHEMGLDTTVLDGNPRAKGLKLGTYSAAIDFSRLDEVYLYLDSLQKKGINLAGVSTMGSDVPQLVAKIAKHYGWHGPSIETGEITTDKYLMKIRLREKGIPIPEFDLVTSAERIRMLWDQWGCNIIIIKPTDRAGSRGVSLIRNRNEVDAAYKKARDNSQSGNVLVEEYLEGLQISTESILYNDRAATPGFVDRVYEGMEGFWPQIMENGAWYPSLLNENERSAVEDLVERTARALDINQGVAKGDVVIHPEKGPMIIEMAARLSGGDFAESLVPMGIGVNYVTDVIRIAIGDEPDWNAMKARYHKAVANRYFFLPPGKLEAVEGLDAALSVRELQKIALFYEIGDQIPVIENHGQRVGVFLVMEENREKVLELVNLIYNTVEFKVNGKWYKGKPMPAN